MSTPVKRRFLSILCKNTAQQGLFLAFFQKKLIPISPYIIFHHLLKLHRKVRFEVCHLIG